MATKQTNDIGKGSSGGQSSGANDEKGGEPNVGKGGAQAGQKYARGHIKGDTKNASKTGRGDE